MCITYIQCKLLYYTKSIHVFSLALAEIVQAIIEIQNKKIVHGDLVGGNLVAGANKHVEVIDFGYSMNFNSDESTFSAFSGTDFANVASWFSNETPDKMTLSGDHQNGLISLMKETNISNVESKLFDIIL